MHQALGICTSPFANCALFKHSHPPVEPCFFVFFLLPTNCNPLRHSWKLENKEKLVQFPLVSFSLDVGRSVISFSFLFSIPTWNG